MSDQYQFCRNCCEPLGEEAWACACGLDRWCTRDCLHEHIKGCLVGATARIAGLEAQVERVTQAAEDDHDIQEGRHQFERADTHGEIGKLKAEVKRHEAEVGRLLSNPTGQIDYVAWRSAYEARIAELEATVERLKAKGSAADEFVGHMAQRTLDDGELRWHTGHGTEICRMLVAAMAAAEGRPVDEMEDIWREKLRAAAEIRPTVDPGAKEAASG